MKHHSKPDTARATHATVHFQNRGCKREVRSKKTATTSAVRPVPTSLQDWLSVHDSVPIRHYPRRD